MKTFLQKLFKGHKPKLGALEILKYIGPGFLVTVGFIDPGNWASNMAAGSQFGYKLLWMVTLSTIMLIFLQHNAAHLGIATGLCLSEAISKYFPKFPRYFVLITAMLASISTALAEILGAAIGLNMLFNLPLNIGALITTFVAILMLISNNYRKIEKYIIGFVSIIGLSFLFELSLSKNKLEKRHRGMDNSFFSAKLHTHNYECFRSSSYAPQPFSTFRDYSK